jgi:hypothetical protein
MSICFAWLAATCVWDSSFKKWGRDTIFYFKCPGSDSSNECIRKSSKSTECFVKVALCLPVTANWGKAGEISLWSESVLCEERWKHTLGGHFDS